MILERFGAGKAKKKQLGRHVHGRVAYGYRSKGGILAPDGPDSDGDGKGSRTAEAASPSGVVRRIFEAAKEGDSPSRIARALNAAGVRSPIREEVGEDHGSAAPDESRLRGRAVPPETVTTISDSLDAERSAGQQRARLERPLHPL